MRAQIVVMLGALAMLPGPSSVEQTVQGTRNPAELVQSDLTAEPMS